MTGFPLEPEALAGSNASAIDPAPGVVQVSIAISLKRIADTLEAMRTEPVNEYGETAAQSIYGGIARGMRGGRP